MSTTQKTYSRNLQAATLITLTLLLTAPVFAQTTEDTYAAGEDAMATATRTTAVGAHASAGTNPENQDLGVGATAIGAHAEARRPGATAIGADCRVIPDDPNDPNDVPDTEVVGAIAVQFSSTAIGCDATARSNRSLAIGANAEASGTDAIAIGANARTSATDAVALGADASASATNAVALGSDTRALGTDAVALGSGTTAEDANSIAIGNQATSRHNSIAIGSESTIRDNTNNAIAIGTSVVVQESADNAIAIGTSADVIEHADNAVAIGNHAIVRRRAERGIAIGHAAQVGEDTTLFSTPDGIAIGAEARVQQDADWGIAIGTAARAGRPRIALGRNDFGAVAIGGECAANEGGARAQRGETIAIGCSSRTTDTAERAVAIGAFSRTLAMESIVIGHDARATASAATGAVVIGAGLRATAPFQVNIGNSQARQVDIGGVTLKQNGIDQVAALQDDVRAISREVYGSENPDASVADSTNVRSRIDLGGGGSGGGGGGGRGIQGASIDLDGNLILTYTDTGSDIIGRVVGEQGPQGAPGSGRAIQSASISAEGNLILTYADASTVPVGRVVGNTGTPGPKGDDGTDGVGINSIAADENGIAFTLSNGNTQTVAVENIGNQRIAANEQRIGQLEESMGGMEQTLSAGIASSLAMLAHAPDPAARFATSLGLGHFNGESAIGLRMSGKVRPSKRNNRSVRHNLGISYNSQTEAAMSLGLTINFH